MNSNNPQEIGLGRFTKVMPSIGFKQSQGAITLFVRQSALKGISALLVYVDDVILNRDDMEELKS